LKMSLTIIRQTVINEFEIHLTQLERAPSTISAYLRAVNALWNYSGARPMTRELLMNYKQSLINQYDAPATINAYIAAVNAFVVFLDRRDLVLKPLRIQRNLFRDESKELKRGDYLRLVEAASCKSRRLSLVIQTICTTGIRVSELRFITAEAVRAGRAEIDNKGKRRIIFLPEKLRRALVKYLRDEKKNTGPVFSTRTGKPLDRSNIWRDMKALCTQAGVNPEKVFPHNLRHLFASTHYTMHRDMTRLADVLGHSCINTTRIYTAESGGIHARQIEALDLLIT